MTTSGNVTTSLTIKDVSTVPFSHTEYLNPSAKEKKASSTRGPVAPTPVDVEAPPTVAVVEADMQAPNNYFNEVRLPVRQMLMKMNCTNITPKGFVRVGWAIIMVSSILWIRLGFVSFSPRPQKCRIGALWGHLLYIGFIAYFRKIKRYTENNFQFLPDQLFKGVIIIGMR
jgi:hypothetical protein